jgi:hypothetical protein
MPSKKYDRSVITRHHIAQALVLIIFYITIFNKVTPSVPPQYAEFDNSTTFLCFGLALTITAV